MSAKIKEDIMGGRGSSSDYIRKQTTDEGRRERAEGIHRILNEAGIPAKKSIEETMEILRQSDVRNGLIKGKPNKTNKVVWEDTGFGSKYAELGDRSVQILDAGKSNLNLYKYGSKQVYEVNRFDGDKSMEKLVFSRKSDAEREAKNFLRNK